MAIQSPPAVTKKTDRMIDRRRVIGSIGVVALAWSPSARSQPARKVARIGIVSIGGPSADMTGSLPRNRNVRAFLRGMAELGYVFGRDFVTEPRGTDSIPVVAELADLQLDMIVATGGILAQAGDDYYSHYHDGCSRPGEPRVCAESCPAGRELYRDEFAESGAHGQASATT